MKLPRMPPATEQLIKSSSSGSIIRAVEWGTRAHRQKYLHWDKLIRYTPPEDMTHEDWWLAIKLGRSHMFKEVPLQDKQGRPFRFLLADPIPEQLHLIDLGAGGQIGIPEQITNPETRDQYYVSSLIEEAITSSQLEGATTTRDVARVMLREHRAPRDRSEQMILNNFRTMQRIGKLQDQSLTRELVLELHRLVTNNTLNDPSAAGRFRRTDEDIAVVGDDGNTVFHSPPPATELDTRMGAMCAFANGETPDYFIHPVIRSIILHFWLAYDHPFVDGNGRTARALFYWSMLHHGFWLCEYLSISQIILKGPAKYSRAFLYTETDDNDLTYFILHQIEVLRRAVNQLHKYIEDKAAKLRAIEQELRGLAHFNHRQRALLSHALRHPHTRYTFEGHRLSHNVVYQTARTDLLALADRGLLTARKQGRTWYFSPTPDLEERLAAIT